MQRQRGELVPIGEGFTDLSGPGKPLRGSHSSHNAYCHELKNSNEKLSTETGQLQADRIEGQRELPGL